MLEAKTNIPVVFIDRDGVINKRMPLHQHVLRWEDFDILPGVYEALGLCNRNGIPTIIISNQRCISLGTLTVKGLNEINVRMCEDFNSHGVHLDGFFYCPHGYEEGCSCRKPRIGLFKEAERELNDFGITIDKSKSWMIGDEDCDIEAGKRIGLRTVHVSDLNDYSKDSRVVDVGRVGDFVVGNLQEAVKLIIGSIKTEARK